MSDAPHSRLDFAQCGRAAALAVECARASQRAQHGVECVCRDRVGENASRAACWTAALCRQGHAADAVASAERRIRRRGRSRHRRGQRSAGSAGRGRRGSHRVHSNDRAGLRAVWLQCLARTGQESVEPGPRSRRFVVWIGGRRCKRRGRGRARFGHRRLAPHSSALLRHHGLEADLWPGLDERRDAARAVTRHHRGAGAQRGRSAAACAILADLPASHPIRGVVVLRRCGALCGPTSQEPA